MKIFSVLNNSIASELLRVVFGLYLLIAIIVTLMQMVFEYRYVEDQLSQKIKSVQESYGPSLATSLWTYNTTQIQSIMKGINALPSVTGMIIIDSDKTYQLGKVDNQTPQLTDNDNSRKNNLFNKILKYEFPIIYEDEGKRIILGTGIIYSNRSIILDQVEYGFFLIIINSFIKTMVLWIILVYFLRKIISKPLTQFASATRQINFDNLSDSNIDIELRNDNELKTLEDSFNSMLNELSVAKYELDEINAGLEYKVRQRTEELGSEVQRRERAQKQAEAANELKSKFLANMSHEIRTPMTCMLGMAKILDSTEINTDKKDKLDLIVRNGDRLLAIINSVLDYSKLESDGLGLEMEDYNLRDCVISNVELFNVQAKKKNIVLEYNIAQDVPVMCHGDSVRLGQVLSNLLSNAIKFSDAGKVIVHVALLVDEKQIMFSVADNGIGIDKDKQETVFKEFVQADASTTRKYGGTGLGLSICKRFIDLMGGNIWVDSEIGKGSTFHFTINLA